MCITCVCFKKNTKSFTVSTIPQVLIRYKRSGVCYNTSNIGQRLLYMSGCIDDDLHRRRRRNGSSLGWASPEPSSAIGLTSDFRALKVNTLGDQPAICIPRWSSPGPAFITRQATWVVVVARMWKDHLIWLAGRSSWILITRYSTTRDFPLFRHSLSFFCSSEEQRLLDRVCPEAYSARRALSWTTVALLPIIIFCFIG